MNERSMKLYELLPEVYRLRDAEVGYPLRALLRIIEDQAEILKLNIDGLWDDFFIETCADWVIPYIGDLVGTNPLHEVGQHRHRADVAKTIYYRRRKGTLPMLEELARDVTGWRAHAVNFFERLGWTQNLNHLRYWMAPNPESRYPNAVDRVGTVNVRNLEALDRLDGPFDVISHSVDVRATCRINGWHNIRNVGFFLWRLKSYQMTDVPARQSTSHSYGYHFSTLGCPAPLFNAPSREADETGLASEIHIPGAIRPAAFHFDLAAYRELYLNVAEGDRPKNSTYYGPARSLEIIKDGVRISPANVMCKDLSNWDRPPGGIVAIDVLLGRLSFAVGEESDEVEVSYNYGFSADMGGGPYDRSRTLASSDDATLYVGVKKGTSVDTLQKALQKWADHLQEDDNPRGIIRILDNAVYGGDITVQLPENGWLVVEADDGRRPNLRLVDDLEVTAPPGGEPSLTLNGLLIQGRVETRGNPRLAITHSTVIPGRRLREDGTPKYPDLDSISTSNGSIPEVEISHSIVGPLRLPAESRRLSIEDSIVDAPKVGEFRRPAIAGDDSGEQPGPPTVLKRTTIFGPVHTKDLRLATEVIFNHTLTVDRLQNGCVRFSYVPEDSTSPRRYRCQPDLALEGVTDLMKQNRIRDRLRPAFTSTRYGHPAYAQLSLSCDKAIRTGAEDGSEMGAFCSLKQPQREINLRARLREYLPFGREAGIIYVN